MARPPLVLSDAPNVVATVQPGFRDTDGTFSEQRAEEINFKVNLLRSSVHESAAGSPVVCGPVSRDATHGCNVLLSVVLPSAVRRL